MVDPLKKSVQTDGEWFISMLTLSSRWRLPQLPSHLSLWLLCEWIWLKFQPNHLVHWYHVLAGAGHWPQTGNQADDRGPESQDWRWQRLILEPPSSNMPGDDTLVHAFCFYSFLAHWIMGRVEGGREWNVCGLEIFCLSQSQATAINEKYF